MNFGVIRKIIGKILLVEAAFMIPALLIALFSHEYSSLGAFAFSIAITVIVGFFCGYFHPVRDRLRVREGLATVGLAWILVSFFGAMPFWLSKSIPSLCDAFFETVSGFTTTGATILNDIEAMPVSMLYWRAFTHWLGGMGVLVFVLALNPSGADKDLNNDAMHLLRAESPGPSVSKLVPRIQKTAGILYKLYIVLTLIEMLMLLLGGLPFFDSLTTAFSTAGTGGFGIRNDSIASYSPYCQVVISVFMLLFGVNFTLYYLILMGEFKKGLKNQELFTYLGIIFTFTAVITLNISHLYSGIGEALRHAFFTVTSLISTSGFATENYLEWPQLSQTLLIITIIVGGMAGSTGGGLKVSRLLILFKSAIRNIYKSLRPGEVRLVHMDGEIIDDDTVASVNNYLIVMVIIICLSTVAVSLNGFSFETNFSAVLTCINNVGPGLGAVGPIYNYSGFSVLTKLVLCADMLLGRLEIYPILILFVPRAWKK